jgi:hypothetical protein
VGSSIITVKSMGFRKSPPGMGQKKGNITASGIGRGPAFEQTGREKDWSYQEANTEELGKQEVFSQISVYAAPGDCPNCKHSCKPAGE